MATTKRSAQPASKQPPKQSGAAKGYAEMARIMHARVQTPKKK